MGHNHYQSDKEARNTLPGFIFLIVLIVGSVFLIRYVAVLINDLLAP